VDEGYIRFSYTLEQYTPPDPDDFPGLSRLRSALHKAGLIGVYPDGVGFGNVSARYGRGSEFIISGSGTGAARVLGREGWSRVIRCTPQKNYLLCRGRIPASSESLTHDAVYRADPRIRFVVHVHHWHLFRKQLERGASATPKDIAFGTVAMAEAVYECIAGRSAEEKGGFLVMAGHEEGVLVYGESLIEIQIILKNRMRVSGSPFPLI